jgi:hypothetical protein
MGILTNYWLAIIIGLILLYLAGDFLWKFVRGAIALGRDLDRAITAVTEIQTSQKGGISDLQNIANEVMTTDRLGHIWGEYTKTLHPQKEPDSLGQSRVIRWRATALADSFFTEQALVDSPLRAEYYKHLPGILTGVGIIGTFSGLILGLLHFNVSSDPALAEEGLSRLLNAVGHAFIVSGTAIAFAMLFTVIEKRLISARYRQVEKLQQGIDKLFATGAEEEYLERLVKASETSATQALQIKDALVADLKQVLSEITQLQVEASARHSSMISTDVGKVISESLGGPMERISQAVDRVGASQGDAVSKLLVDVLASFSGQIREMFGGQMSGLSDVLQQSAQAMQSTAAKFEQLAANMELAGKSAADAMSERLVAAVAAMEARQQLLNHQMGEFVDQIRALVAQSQTETSLKLQETLTQLGDQVLSVVGQLQSQVESTASVQQEHTSRLARETGAAVGAISSQVEQLIAQSLEVSGSLQASVRALSSATTDSIAKMNSGAEMLYIASSDFAKAGETVTESIELFGPAVEKIHAVSQSLLTASNTTQQVTAEYANARDSFALIVSDLKGTIENAKREAGLTSELVASLRIAAEQLNQAERQAQEYLAGISEVLGKAHQAFADSIEKTLRAGNAQFHKELSEAVSLLSGGIQDLGDLLENLPSKG